MKLRIKGNSLRLRLTKKEVQFFLEKGLVKETIKFGSTAFNQMHYSIQKTKKEIISATYNLNQIAIYIPEPMIIHWATSSEISISHTCKINERETLLLLIEKDFKCLTIRTGEEETDMYENPAGNIHKC